MERSGFPETIITTKIVYQYLRQFDICFGNGAKRISRNYYLGFGKSYLIPETTNFDIGEGIVYKKGFKPRYHDPIPSYIHNPCSCRVYYPTKHGVSEDDNRFD